MISKMLIKARRYEADAALDITDEMRPDFHLSSYCGWMNDPNGFSLYQGKYHMFYQYYPYKSVWGPMHWGHAVSKDLLHWEFLPCALAPDMHYDEGGCFSGSAIELADGRQLLLYTAVETKELPDHSVEVFQRQAAAVGNGIDYEKLPQNPLIGSDMLPAGASTEDFRDPKMIRQPDGSLLCVAGGRRTKDKNGELYLYSSPDGFSWKYESTLVSNDINIGKMWECPDFFELDGAYVVLTSPQDMLPEGFEYHSGNNTLCLLGTYDKESKTFQTDKDQSVDYGIDFYAPQTILTTDGRRVMIGWMQNWDACAIREPDSLWAGQMSLPRELSVRDGRLYQKPLRELDQYLTDKVLLENLLIPEGEKKSFEGIEGRVLDLRLKIRPADEDKNYDRLVINLAENEKFRTILSFRPKEGILKIDRKFSGSRRAIVHQRRCLVDGFESQLDLRIIMDRYSIEVFIFDGRQVMTATIYTELSARGISFEAVGGDVSLDIEKYRIDMNK